MALNIELPVLQHKWIKLYNSQSEQELDEANYEECCVFVIKDPNAGEETNAEYQYSVRTTNNDNLVKGKYYSQEDPDYWSGLEIIWGYFGWEFTPFTWNHQELTGGNLFLKIATSAVRSIPDGSRLQHINNFLGSQDNINLIEEFDNSNIISAVTLNGYRSTDSNRVLTCNISNWNAVENAEGMWQNITLTVKDNVLNLPVATHCSHIFASDTNNTISFNWNIPNAVDMSYAFYNVEGDINPLDNNLFEQDKVTNVDYCFAATTLKQININCSQIPLATTAKGLFAYRTINNNNNNNNIELPKCEYLDYALQACDLSQIGNINFTAVKLKSAKGLLKDSIPNQTENWNGLKALTTFNTVEDFSEYLMNINDNSVTISFDISEQTGEQEVKLKDFCSNSNIKLAFKGNSKCNYDDFAHNAIIDMPSDYDFSNGISYKNAFSKNTFVTGLPILAFEADKNYDYMYENIIAQGHVTFDIDSIPASSIDVFKGAQFNNGLVFNNLNNLPHINLDFSVEEADNFDFDLSDNTSDYGWGDDYIGYKPFRIGTNFNYRTFKEQTINTFITDKDTEETDNPSRLYLINNNAVTDLHNLTINCIADKEAGINSNYTQLAITSQSMTYSPKLIGNIQDADYRRLAVLNISNCPNLIQLNLEMHISYNSNIKIDNNVLQYLILKNTNGTHYYSSEILDIPTLTESINNGNNSFDSLSIKQVVYDKLDTDTQQKLISICRSLNLIQN